MLTATYSLVAISAEQKNAQTILRKLRQYIQACVKKLQEVDISKLETMFNKLTQFDQYCHARKVEVYLIPAIRGATHEVDSLLAELESMSARAITILKSVQDHLRQAWGQGVDKIQELYNAMEIYCDNLLTRLTREEQELLPILERLFSIDEWFAIAAKFLSDDADQKNRRAPPRLPAPI
ncbi:MAG TPA: hemerythrin domain-containing protein [Burkholderiaceae bacterium]|nr:hemerythrin domain-containing protein [Burkholderiaceae bacterium]